MITPMRVKYQRNSTIEQHGERFGMDKEQYALSHLIRNAIVG